jgi:type I restriction enzyme S subunit
MTFYKETEFRETTIGKIPKEWDVKETEELGEVVTGITPSTFVKEYWNGDYPFVTPTDMTNGKYVEKTERKVTAKGLEKGRLIPKDSVLVTCIASIGKMALAFEDCLTNQQINAIICKEGVNPHYVYYALGFRTPTLKSWAGQTTNPIIKKSLFEKFPISLPRNEPEQQNIAEVLSTVDLAIQKTDNVIWKTERLKKGLMQTLLTKGIGRTEYKDTPIGKTPKTWQILQVGDLFSLEYGKGLPDRERIPGPYPVVGSNGVIGHHNQALVKGPGIVVGRKGTIGAVSWINENYWPIDTTYYIKPKTTNMSLKWLFHALAYLNPARFHLADVVPGLKRELVYSLKIGFPSLPEQEKIADVLSTIDRKLDLERKEKSKLERVKRGLMDLLLTGKVRVKVD